MMTAPDKNVKKKFSDSSLTLILGSAKWSRPPPFNHSCLSRPGERLAGQNCDEGKCKVARFIKLKGKLYLETGLSVWNQTAVYKSEDSAEVWWVLYLSSSLRPWLGIIMSAVKHYTTERLECSEAPFLHEDIDIPSVTMIVV